MCGIAGIATNDSAEAFVASAQRMAVAMTHRGPDSQGLILRDQCLLVNARLAILDLSERARQPMSNADGTVWLTYNGEVYNAAELREDLIGCGYTFHSTSDTEVILHLYEQYGEDCVNRLRGMFAFAIWDGRAQKLVLARDRMGIKPLYLAHSGGRLVFGSELKTLLASGLVERRLDPAGVRVYLQLGHVPAPWTILRGIEPMPAGHVGVWQNGQWSSRAYWELRPPDGTDRLPASEENIARLGDILLEAMKEHLLSDVPILLFLSGGTDSACLGALARAAGAKNMSALTVGFGESEFDETNLAKRTAKHLDIPLEVSTLTGERVLAEVGHAIWALDQPSVDGLNTYWISRLGASAGFKVALSGLGGDELFGGYESMAWFKRFVQIGRWTSSWPEAPFSWLLDRDILSYRHRKLSYLFGSGDAFLASQLVVKSLFVERDVRRLVTAPFQQDGHGGEAWLHLSRCAEKLGECELEERLAFMDLETHLKPRLLRDVDAVSMAHSIELRPVFLDSRIIDFVIRLPPQLPSEHKRVLLKATRRFLPEGLARDLASRPKRTFTFPFTRWLGGAMDDTIENTFTAERVARIGLNPDAVRSLWQRYRKQPASVGWSRIWILYVLIQWCEMMAVGL